MDPPKMRKWSVSESPTCFVATYQSTSAMSAWQPSFARAERPSERFFEILVQSSRKPSAALAMATPNTVRLAVSYWPRIRNGTPTARKTTRPPIVGVPAFTAWAAGPSSRMCCPNSFCRRYSMNFGPRKMQMSRDAIPAMRTRPSMLPLARQHPFEADGTRSLDQHAVARSRQLLENGPRLLRGGHRVALAAEALGYRQRRLAHRHEHVDPQLVRSLADLAVVARCLGPKLGHRSEDRDPPLGRGLRKVV